MDQEHGVGEETRRSEQVDAAMPHQPDKAPTEEEERSADAAGLSPEQRAEVARHHQEMDRLGAEVEGEGKIA